MAGLPLTHGRAVVITPADGADLANPTRAIYVGGTGTLTVTMADTGTDVLFSAIPVGTILPIRAKRVKATGTTATLLVALY